MFREFSTRQRIALLIPLLVAGVTFGLVWATGSSDPGRPEDAVIEALIPQPETKVLQQGDLGIDLRAGWEADLFVNGVPIPKDQLAINRGQARYTFRPGPGQEVEVLGPGQNCVTAIYWATADPTRRYNRTWCFSVL